MYPPLPQAKGDDGTKYTPIVGDVTKREPLSHRSSIISIQLFYPYHDEDDALK